MERFLITFLKGVWIGGTLTVPGVSGGTMAIMMGIYQRLLQAVNHLNDRKNIRFLITVGSGGLVGIIALSGVISRLLEWHLTLMSYFFIGAVVGGIPSICREMRTSVFKWHQLMFLFCGAGLVLGISRLPVGAFSLSEGSSVMMQLLGGLIAAAALVLPGISVSHMLYVLGIYESLMVAISEWKIFLLLPFSVGMISGVFLTAKLVDRLLIRYKTQTYLLVLGFVFASLGEMVAVACKGAFSFVYPLAFLAGFLPLWLLHKNNKVGA